MMMLSNWAQPYMQFKCSKAGDFFSSWGGAVRRPAVDLPSPTKLEPVRVGDAPPGGSKAVQQGADSFPGQGHLSGSKGPGDAPHAPDTPELAEYKAKQQKEWQASQDAKARDKLFEQPTQGQVDGKGVEPFSAKRLEEESASVKAAVEKAAPARNGTLLRAAVIAAPFSVLGLVVAGTVNAFLKPIIDPPASGNVTKQDFQDTRVVEAVQKSVATAVNAWSDTKGLAHPAPSELSWALKSNEERMDVLEEMMDILEKNLAIDAKAMGIDVSFASTGEPKDDIASRALAINSRLAVITELFAKMKDKIKPDAV
jgi:hypothetical protein